jgi:hypothetical protein
MAKVNKPLTPEEGPSDPTTNAAIIGDMQARNAATKPAAPVGPTRVGTAVSGGFVVAPKSPRNTTINDVLRTTNKPVSKVKKGSSVDADGNEQVPQARPGGGMGLNLSTGPRIFRGADNPISERSMRNFLSKFKGMSDEDIENQRRNGAFLKYATDENHENELVLRARAQGTRGTSSTQKGRIREAMASPEGKAYEAQVGRTPGVAPTREERARYASTATSVLDTPELPNYSDIPRKGDYVEPIAGTRDHGNAMSKYAEDLSRATQALPITQSVRHQIAEHINNAYTSIGHHYNSYMAGIDSDLDTAKALNIGTGRGKSVDKDYDDIDTSASSLSGVTHLRNAGNSLVSAAALLHRHSRAFRDAKLKLLVAQGVSHVLNNYKTEIGDTSGHEDLGTPKATTSIEDIGDDNRTLAELQQQHQAGLRVKQIDAEANRGTTKLPVLPGEPGYTAPKDLPVDNSIKSGFVAPKVYREKAVGDVESNPHWTPTTIHDTPTGVPQHGFVVTDPDVLDKGETHRFVPGYADKGERDLAERRRSLASKQLNDALLGASIAKNKVWLQNNPRKTVNKGDEIEFPIKKADSFIEDLPAAKDAIATHLNGLPLTPEHREAIKEGLRRYGKSYRDWNWTSPNGTKFWQESKPQRHHGPSAKPNTEESLDRNNVDDLIEAVHRHETTGTPNGSYPKSPGEYDPNYIAETGVPVNADTANESRSLSTPLPSVSGGAASERLTDTREAVRRLSERRKSAQIDYLAKAIDENPRPGGVKATEPELNSGLPAGGGSRIVANLDSRGGLVRVPVEQRQSRSREFDAQQQAIANSGKSETNILRGSDNMTERGRKRAVQDQLKIYEQADAARERSGEGQDINPQIDFAGNVSAASDAFGSNGANRGRYNVVGRRRSVFENAAYNPKVNTEPKLVKKERLKAEKETNAAGVPALQAKQKDSEKPTVEKMLEDVFGTDATVEVPVPTKKNNSKKAK